MRTRGTFHAEPQRRREAAGSATVAEVRDALEDEMAYTTVLAVLRRLEEKGYATRREEGRAHRYLPALERQAARESALERLKRRLFHGSSELLLTHRVSRRKLSGAEL